MAQGCIRGPYQEKVDVHYYQYDVAESECLHKMAGQKLLRILGRTPSRFLFAGLVLCMLIILLLNCSYPTTDRPTSAIGETRLKKTKELSVVLAVFVISAPGNSIARKVARETWAKVRPAGVLVRFVVGTANLTEALVKQLQTEHSTYGDLVLLDDLVDSYKSLTSKLLCTFSWAVTHMNFKFLLKLDEDSYARLDLIVNELANKSRKRLYWGFFDGRARVYKAGKWAEKEYVLCDRYLPYALGGGYVLSEDLVEYVVDNSHYLKKFQSEDASLGTWLGPLDIERLHDPRFNTEYKSRGCYNSYLVMHKQSQEDMYNNYQTIKATGELCSKEYRVRLSYVYDWSQLPSKCCIRSDETVP